MSPKSPDNIRIVAVVFAKLVEREPIANGLNLFLDEVDHFLNLKDH